AAGDLERELHPLPGRSGGCLARPQRRRRRGAAGDQVPGRPVPRDDVQRARLRGGARRPLAVERRRDPVQGRDRGRGGRLRRHAVLVVEGGDRPGPRGEGARRHLRRRAGLEPLRAQRPHAGRPAPAVQAGLARRPAEDRPGLARRGPHHACRAGRRLEHRAGGRRRLGHGRLLPLHPRLATRTGRFPRDRGHRVRRRRPPVHAGARRLHVLGLHAAALPAPRGHADRLRARLPRARRPGDERADRPRGTQGQGRQRPRAGGRRPRGL
ncbi:MAG: Exodeoxyribonuclease III, partial [uncultured Blastococcus sp.]